jgi:hypothetical protein
MSTTIPALCWNNCMGHAAGGAFQLDCTHHGVLGDEFAPWSPMVWPPTLADGVEDDLHREIHEYSNRTCTQTVPPVFQCHWNTTSFSFYWESMFRTMHSRQPSPRTWCRLLHSKLLRASTVSTVSYRYHLSAVLIVNQALYPVLSSLDFDSITNERLRK